MVGDFKSVVLAVGLDALHHFAGKAFAAQVVGHLDVERNGERALVGNYPAGDVFAHDFHVGAFHRDAFALHGKRERAFGFEVGNLGLSERVD